MSPQNSKKNNKLILKNTKINKIKSWPAVPRIVLKSESKCLYRLAGWHAHNTV